MLKRTMPIKLNVGCGNDYKQGYINIDSGRSFCNNGLDREEDMRCMDFEPNSVDEIIAEGCIEHISYRDVMPTLLHWFNILKPNGKLVIETPNLQRVLLDQVQTQGIFNSHIYETLYGGQRNPTEYHLALWSYEVLSQIMLIVGYKEIKRLKPIKNPEKGNDWNIRIEGIKLHDWAFPMCAKECCK